MIHPDYKKYSDELRLKKSSNTPYNKLHDGPMDEIDAAIWSGDIFHNRKNIDEFRSVMARWEAGLKEAEQILDEMEKENANT